MHAPKCTECHASTMGNHRMQGRTMKARKHSFVHLIRKMRSVNCEEMRGRNCEHTGLMHPIQCNRAELMHPIQRSATHEL